MQLVTSNLILHYFPPSVSDLVDVPKYALQSKEQTSFETLPLTKSDHLSVVEDQGVAQLKINDNLIGNFDVSSDDSKKELDEFVKCWNSGLEKVCQDEQESVISDDLIDSLRKRLTSHQNDLIIEKELSIRVVSWNLHGDPLYENDTEQFDKLLRDDSDSEWADIMVVCFQETIPLNAKNLSSSLERVQNWENKLLSYLPSTYHKLKSNRLLGLTLLVFTTDELQPQINSITTSTIGTGLLGIWANKGAIVMNFKIGYDDMCGLDGFNFQIFNCHLASGPGREMLQHRCKELFDIQRKFKVIGNGKLVNENWVENNDEMEKYLYYDELDEMTNELDLNDHSYDESERSSDENSVKEVSIQEEDLHELELENDGLTLFCGDLNYRVFMGKEEIQLFLKRCDYSSIMAFEGLDQERRAKKIFVNFKEGKIDFEPTYKYSSNGEFDFSRIPSYCDRILYTPHKSLEQVSYQPVKNVLASDHKPILSNFKLQTKLINFEKKSEIAARYFKEQDKLENESRPVVEISRQDIPMLENHYLIPNSATTILKNNGSKGSLSWEILLLETDSSGIVTIEPMSGDLECGNEQRITITGVLPIGVTEYSNTSILRVHNLQDFFISYSFKSLPSIFGLDLVELGLKSSGIPKSIYQLINFLSEHNYEDMFEEDMTEFNEIDYKLIRDLDLGNDLDTLFLDNQLMINSIKSVLKMLYLILKNLPNGVVDMENSIKLINHFFNSGNKKTIIKSSNGNDEILIYLMEILPSLELNLLIFLMKFFKILINEFKFDKGKLISQFQNILFKVPLKFSKRKMVTDSNVRNLKKRRTELILKLICD